jgi:hypothetical protein
VRSSRTVREIRVFDIMASYGKGVFILHARVGRGSLGTLKGSFDILELSLSSLTHFALRLHSL